MACERCKKSEFWQKIGRCQRCVNQLTFLSVICWIVWGFGFSDDIRSVESIALIFAGLAFHSLLFLHLWFKFFVLPNQM